MLKSLVTAGAYTSGNIQTNLYKNTNNKYLAVGDAFEIRTNGLTEIKANITASVTTAGTLTLQAYANGVIIPGATSTITLAANGTGTFQINDVIKTVYDMNQEYARITFDFSGACNIIGGDIILTYAR